MEERRYLTVSALNQYLKAKLDQDIHLQKIYLQGELSNLKFHSSGHYYFTLKDEKSRINAVMFSSYAGKLKIKLENGMKVLIVGSISVYVNAGNFQLYVYHIEPDGVGQLYIAYEQLKKKLFDEGLFDESHKKKIPPLPKTVGIITGYPSAALQDILKTLRHRYPLAKIKLFPTLVQGEGAYKKIIQCINKADQLNLDVLILARGGGSLEDLWNFNNEDLVRTVFACHTPIITGVGHEIDTTLVDYVSDLRAVTPTAAAISAVPDIRDLMMKNDQNTEHLQTLILHKLSTLKQQYQFFKTHPRLNEPDLIISDFKNKLIQKNIALNNTMEKKLRLYQFQYDDLTQKITHNSQMFISQQRHILLQRKQKMTTFIQQSQSAHKIKFSNQLEQLNLLNPLSILQRGYAVVETDKHVIKSVKNVDIDENIQIRLSDGKIKAIVKEKS